MSGTHKRPALLIYDATWLSESSSSFVFLSLPADVLIFFIAIECCNYNRARTVGRDKVPDILSLSNGRWLVSEAVSTARRRPNATNQRQCFHTEENCSCCRSFLDDVAAIDLRDVHRLIRPIAVDWADFPPGRPNLPCPVTDYRKDFSVDDAASS